MANHVQNTAVACTYKVLVIIASTRLMAEASAHTSNAAKDQTAAYLKQ